MKRALVVLLVLLIFTGCAVPNVTLTETAIIASQNSPEEDVRYVQIDPVIILRRQLKLEEVKQLIGEEPASESSLGLEYENVLLADFQCEDSKIRYYENGNLAYVSFRISQCDEDLFVSVKEYVANDNQGVEFDVPKSRTGRDPGEYKFIVWSNPVIRSSVEYEIAEQTLFVSYELLEDTILSVDEYYTSVFTNEEILYLSNVTQLVSSIERCKKSLIKALDEFQITNIDTDGIIRINYDSIAEYAQEINALRAPEKFAAVHELLIEAATAYQAMGERGSYGIQNFDSQAFIDSEDARSSANSLISEYISELKLLF